MASFAKCIGGRPAIRTLQPVASCHVHLRRCCPTGAAPSSLLRLLREAKPRLLLCKAEAGRDGNPAGESRPEAMSHTSERVGSSADAGLAGIVEQYQPFVPASAARPAASVDQVLRQREEEALSRMTLQEREEQGDVDLMALAEGRAASTSGVGEKTSLEKWMFPDKDELPEQLQMPIWDHLEELRERVLISGLACAAAILTCFVFSKDLVVFLEAPVASAGVRFLQLSPGEFFFTTLKTAGYSGLLLAAPTVLYEIIAYILPGLTRSERRFLAPVILGSSVLFYLGLVFSYEVLTPAALNFFVDYADGAVESLWSIDQYFEFVLVLMLSTGLAFQVPVIQVMLGQLGIVTSEQMLSQWRYVVVGSTIAAAVLTPSTDPFTQALLAIPLVGLYMAGASAVKVLEAQKAAAASLAGR